MDDRQAAIVTALVVAGAIGVARFSPAVGWLVTLPVVAALLTVVFWYDGLDAI